MAELLALLAELQQRIAQQGFPELLPGDRERILFTEEHGGLCVEFYGDPLGESFPELLGTLSRPEVASRLDYLVLRGPDEGANGTRNWDLTALLESETEFPRLRALFLQPSGPEWHNRSIVAAEYDEAGMLGQVLDRAPVLGALTAPSAPDRSFLQRGPHPLQHLRIEAGYDPQGFIRNLAEATCFPELRHLDYTDYCERYSENYPRLCTPAEDFHALFQSPAFDPLRAFTLRNSTLNREQLAALKALRPSILFTVVQASGKYVRG